MNDYAIEAEGLVKHFGATVALDGVDLRARTGSVLGLLGPNGAGKTTAVRILATLIWPDAGSARVGAHDVRTDPQAVRRRIGLTERLKLQLQADVFNAFNRTNFRDLEVNLAAVCARHGRSIADLADEFAVLDGFERVIVIDDGRIAFDGTPAAAVPAYRELIG